MGTIAFLTQLLLLGLSIFLMIVVLLQRGRGGGLAGAFGGLGGQSAFGTKAGDVFTKITIVTAVCWVVVAGGSGLLLRAAAERRAQDLPQVEAAGISSAEGEDEGAGLGADAVPQPDEDAPAVDGSGTPAGNDPDPGDTDAGPAEPSNEAAPQSSDE